MENRDPERKLLTDFERRLRHAEHCHRYYMAHREALKAYAHAKYQQKKKGMKCDGRSDEQS